MLRMRTTVHVYDGAFVGGCSAERALMCCLGTACKLASAKSHRFSSALQRKEQRTSRKLTVLGIACLSRDAHQIPRHKGCAKAREMATGAQAMMTRTDLAKRATTITRGRHNIIFVFRLRVQPNASIVRHCTSPFPCNLL